MGFLEGTKVDCFEGAKLVKGCFDGNVLGMESSLVLSSLESSVLSSSVLLTSSFVFAVIESSFMFASLALSSVMVPSLVLSSLESSFTFLLLVESSVLSSLAIVGFKLGMNVGLQTGTNDDGFIDLYIGL